MTKHKISEKEALNIFYEIVKVVEVLHSRNIIHRDLKLNNIVLDKRTNKIILTNFCLGKHLNSENDNLHDQRGSPAYISPDVLTGSYKGKPSDMWSCAVILYTMIYSHFPFIESTTALLFKKIRSADYVIPDVRVSDDTKKLIKNLLSLNPEERFTAGEVRLKLESFQKKYHELTKASILVNDDQVVPEIDVEPKTPSVTSDGPKFDVSSEQTSLLLEMLPSPLAAKESKTFLKPSSLANVPIRRYAAEGLPDRYVNLNLQQNLYSNNSARSLTRQINNLTVRGRINSVFRNISWHNRIFPSNPRNVYEVQVREVTGNNRQVGTRNGSSAIWSANMENFIQQLRQSNQPINCDVQHTVPNPPPAISTPSANPTPSPNSAANYDDAIVNIFVLLHRLFSDGEIPTLFEPLEFTGIITRSFAESVIAWLRRNFGRNQLIQDIFFRRDSQNTNNEVLMVQEFFRKIGVQMEVVSGIVKVKKEQHSHLLLVLTYFLQIAGYSNSYFLNIVP